MSRLGVIGGHSILGTGFAAGAERVDVDVPGGPVAVLDTGEFVLLQRHGMDRFRSAPYVDHAANLHALGELGVTRILGLASTGGLRRELGVGTFLVPDDFIALHLGLSFADDDAGHQVPGFHGGWRRVVVDEWRRVSEVPLLDGGVYWQTVGPRFETRAEIGLIAAHADVVGMTIAAEAILAGELGVPYAAICVVDNLANGVGEEPVSIDEWRAGVVTSRRRLLAALDALLPGLAKIEVES